MNKNVLYILIGIAVFAGLAAMYGAVALLSMLIGAQTTLNIFVWLFGFMLSVAVVWSVGFFVCASAEFHRNETARKEARKYMGYGE